MKSIIAVLFVVISSAYSQVIGQGTCPELQAVQNFNVSRYMGTWYEVRRYYNNYEAETICQYVSYSLESNGSVNVVGVATNLSTGVKQEALGIANFSKNGLGEFEVYILSNNLDTKFSILGTDYDNYSSVISCINLGVSFHYTYAWLFTRTRDASTEVINNALKAFEAQNVSTSALQDGCLPF